MVQIKNLGSVIFASSLIQTGVLSAAPPVVTRAPASREYFSGGGGFFNIIATGTATLSYQWFKDGVAIGDVAGKISGTTTNSLSIANLIPGDTGTYACRVTNGEGVVYSPGAIGRVLESKPQPTVFTLPKAVLVPVGGLTINSLMTGSTPITYQWLRNGEEISGATNSTLSLAFDPLVEGTYVLRATNAFGTTDGPPIAVSVGDHLAEIEDQTPPNVEGRALVKILDQNTLRPGADVPGTPFGTFGKMRFREGSILFTAGGSNGNQGLFRWKSGVLQRIASTDATSLDPSGRRFSVLSYPTEEIGGVFHFVAETYVVGTFSPLIAIYKWNNGVMTRVISTSDVPPGGGQYFGFGQLAARGDTLYWASATNSGNKIYRKNASGVSVVLDNTMELPGNFKKFSAVPGDKPQFNFDGEYLLATLQDDSTPTLQASFAFNANHQSTLLADSTQTTYYADPGQADREDGGLVFSGSGNYEGAFSLPTGTPQVSRLRTPGSEVTAATADEYFTRSVYLYHSGPAHRVSCIPTATLDGSSVIGIINLEADGHELAAWLRVQAGNLQSIYASIEPVAETTPVVTYITPSPALPLLGGEPLTLRAVATGGGLSWQWNRNGAPILGANRPFLILPSLSEANEGNYTVTVTNGITSTTSSACSLDVIMPPAIPAYPTGPPQFTTLSPSQTVALGQTGSANLLTNANPGGSATTYEWFRNGLPFPSTGSNNLLLNPPTIGTYTARITNAAGSTWSQPISVSYLPAPGSPVIASTTHSNGVITLVFTSLLGKNYLVDYSSDLGTTPWAPLGTYPGTGAEMTRTFTATGSSGFYRVVELAP
jgi:hypothetical protein